MESRKVYTILRDPLLHRTHRVRPYKCSDCPKAFTQRCSLESHCRKVHGQPLPYAFKERRTKLYICEECGFNTQHLELFCEHSHTQQPNHQPPIYPHSQFNQHQQSSQTHPPQPAAAAAAAAGAAAQTKLTSPSQSTGRRQTNSTSSSRRRGSFDLPASAGQTTHEPRSHSVSSAQGKTTNGTEASLRMRAGCLPTHVC
ncbi:unnamed protein product [Echinostoma caproni]|uniref:C2H2-type domain-containing protein n=1 Tax=Echinostoma caproni TaxID=27848 RepID=A0A183AL82_9TREM|nr:unnamed protein product [Echinostoma caproni]